MWDTLAVAISTGSQGVVVTANCVLASFILMLAYGLWRCRQTLVNLNQQLRQVEINSQPWRYAIALQRVQLVQTKLGVARWQLRSQQIRQIIRLIKLLQTLQLLRTGRYRPSKRSKNRFKNRSHKR